MSNWMEKSIPYVLAVVTALVLLFASTTTSRLHDSQRKLHAGATREPQMADPAETYREVVLETSRLAQLSSGYTGIAPSMHLVRMAAARPLSNVDPIEHPARRRFGRVDFSFAFLVYLPIALIPVCLLIYRKCSSRGDVEKLTSGRTTIFDFAAERILLPLAASGGLVLLVTIACLYGAGVTLPSNDLLVRLGMWGLLIALYLLGWILLFAFLLLRTRSFPTATLYYAASFLVVAFLAPQLLQTFALSVERPKGRLPLLVERRKLAQQYRVDDREAIDRFLQRQGFGAMDWTEPLPQAQAVALVNLRIEEAIRPKLDEFEGTVARLDQIAMATAWLSPYLVAQEGVDELAGTGLKRYSEFRKACIAYHEEWRKYTLGYLAKRQFLDFDGLRGVPKFSYSAQEPEGVVLSSGVRLAYLGGICVLLGLAAGRELRKMLPRKKKTAR